MPQSGRTSAELVNARLCFLGLEIGGRGDFQQLAIVRHIESIMGKSVGLKKAIALGDCNFSFAFEPKPSLAFEDEDHLKAGDVTVFSG